MPGTLLGSAFTEYERGVLSKVSDMGAVAVLCRVGSLVCGVPVEHVTETMRPLPIDPLAGAPPFVRGVSVVRGAPVPVIDAARMLGSPEALARSSSPGMFVALRVAGRVVALSVDSVVGVASLPAASLEDLPPLLHDASAEAVSAIGTHDSQLLLVLSAARLAPPSVWAAFDARGSRP